MVIIVVKYKVEIRCKILLITIITHSRLINNSHLTKFHYIVEISDKFV